MKRLLETRAVAWAAALTTLGTVSAASITKSDDASGAVVPDASASGLTRVIPVPDAGWRIVDVNITVSLAGVASVGGWTGDLYAWLGHEGALAVLLNRPGRTGLEKLGYADDGLSSVVLDDEAGADVHFYQATLGGAPGVLTGSWQPDARFVDPSSPFDPNPALRVAHLSVFDGLDPQGDWVLFLADLSGGGEVQLDRWQIDLTVIPVPEPAGAALWSACFLAGLAIWQRRRQRT